jgi:tRNA 2-selenouridine synthase
VIEGDLSVRTALLLDEYRHFTDDFSRMAPQLERLIPMHGLHQIQAWRNCAEQSRWGELVESLLSQHYDPAYDRSMRSNFVRFDDAPIVRLESASPAGIAAAAERLVAACDNDAGSGRTL